ncbi:MAG: SAM-dependent methyltransferase [Chloroflexi bacterium]|nr:SAM-dependent methyltransferase [Chloroflexota bacterium]
MNNKFEINTPETWKFKLGLFPVPLFGNIPDEMRYVLLNGNDGNFCLDLNKKEEKTEQRNYAWSLDVGHYVKILKDSVKIYRWDKSISSLEIYSKKSVEENLEKFYIHLQKDQPRRDISIIYFVMTIFGRLRNILRNNNGQKSLKAFLCLLACSSDSTVLNSLDIEKWKLDNEAVNIAKQIRDADWEALIHELKKGYAFYELQPNISLLLRHASGKLFQEAHYEILRHDDQLMLAGIPPEPSTISKKTESVGAFYTPSSLARTLVEEALSLKYELSDFTEITIFDPACGSGEFLKESLRQLSLANYNGQVKLIGWDNSEAAVSMSKFVLSQEILYYDNDNVSIDISFKNDALAENNWPQNIDLVLMNPPFLSWEGMSDEKKTQIKNILGDLCERRPDYSSAFILKAIRSLGENGVLGTVMPSSILHGDSYKKYRDYLSYMITPYLIGNLGSQSIFTKALVDTAIYVGRTSKSKEKDLPTLALWSDHLPQSTSAALRSLRKYRSHRENEYFVIDEQGYSIYPDPSLRESSENWAPCSYKSYKVFELLQEKNIPLVKELFKIHQGARTGLNEVFIMKKSVYQDLPKKEKRYFRPALYRESIKQSVLNDLTYVFYPYDKNLPEICDEADLAKHLKTYYENFLLKNKNKLEERAKIDTNRWWELTWHRGWQVEREPKLVSTSFGKSGYFAWDNTGDYVVVQGHYWEPKRHQKRAHFDEDIGLAYLAILCSPLIDILLANVSKHVGGGQWDLSSKFIQNMPMPDLLDQNIEIDILNELKKIGNSINQERDYDIKHLNKLVLSMYRLPEDIITANAYD